MIGIGRRIGRRRLADPRRRRPYARAREAANPPANNRPAPAGEWGASGGRHAEAEALAATGDDLGLAAALVVAQGHGARIDPHATRGVAGAALTLGAPPAALLAYAAPLHSDADLLAAAGQLEGDAGELLGAATAVRDAALAGLDAAVAAIRAAHRQDDHAAAEQQIRRAEIEAADCEAAIDVTDVLIQRLTYAITRLGEVPDDLETTYEVPYAHVRRGSTLPHSGDFLTAPTEGAA